MLRAVLFPFAVLTGAHGNDVPWWVHVQPVPLLTADPAGVLLNTALFVPLGVLLPLLARTDDLLADTLGGVMGYAAFRAAVSVPAVARVAAAARWRVARHRVRLRRRSPARPWPSCSR